MSKTIECKRDKSKDYSNQEKEYWDDLDPRGPSRSEYEEYLKSKNE